MHRDTNICEFSNSRLALRADLAFTLQTANGQKYYAINDPLHSRFFRVGIAEYTFLSLLDGRSSVRDCYSRMSSASPLHSLTENDIAGLCRWAIEMDLVRNDDARFRERSAAANREKQPKSQDNPLVFRVQLGKPDRLLSRIAGVAGWLFSLPAAIVWFGLLLLAAYRIAANWDRFLESSKTVLSADNWIWLAACGIALKLFHEIAHGTVCKRYDGTVRQAGILFVLFAPLPYVDVTSSWSFRSRFARMHVAVAGVYIELLIAAIAAFVWDATSPGWLNHLAFNIVVLASATSLLFNLNPLMRFDGYYVLADFLGIPNLYPNGQVWLRHWAKRCFFHVETLLPDWSPRDRRIIATFGLASFVWRSFICVSLTVTAATLFEGAGIALALLAVVLWIVAPLINCVKYILFGKLGEEPDRLRFALTFGGLVTTVSLVFCYVPWLGNFQAPAIVEFAPLSVARAETSGFIRKIYVESGQQVQQGQPLVTLENPELAVEIADLKLELRQSELRANQHEQEGQIAERQAEQQVLASLRTQLDEKQKLFAQLTIHAAIDGRVVTRNLQSKLGTYANEGDEILAIGNEDEKELRVAVAQNELKHFLHGLHHQVTVHVPQRPLLHCSVEKVVPRATVSLLHPALAATNGGSLPVKPTSDDNARRQFELLQPRFDVVVSIGREVGAELRAGQRADVTCRTTASSIGQHLYQTASNWLRCRLSKH